MKITSRGIARATITAALAAGLGLSCLVGCGGGAQTAEVAATTQAAGVADVASMLAILAFDGRDVSVEASKVTLGISSDGNVVVTEATDADDATVVTQTCERAAALAASVNGAEVSGADGAVEATRATWVSTTPDGNVTCAVSYEPGKAPEKGSTEDLVKGSGGYTMSDAAHDAAGLPADLPATGGDAVTDASGEPVTPGQAPADAGEVPTEGSSGAQSGSASTSGSNSASSTKPSSGGQSQASSSSGSSSSSSGKPSGSSGSSSSSKPSHQHSWQAVYRDEAVYGQKWVSKMVDVYKGRQSRYYIITPNGKVGPFDSQGAADDWVMNDMINGGSGGSLLDDSYDIWETEDQGSYQTVQTGTKQVLDHYECSCGARK